MSGRHPPGPEANPPWEDTTPPPGRPPSGTHPRADTPAGKHPLLDRHPVLGRHTPSGMADTLPKVDNSLGRHLHFGQTPLCRADHPLLCRHPSDRHPLSGRHPSPAGRQSLPIGSRWYAFYWNAFFSTLENFYSSPFVREDWLHSILNLNGNYISSKFTFHESGMKFKILFRYFNSKSYYKIWRNITASCHVCSWCKSQGVNWQLVTKTHEY